MTNNIGNNEAFVIHGLSGLVLKCQLRMNSEKLKKRISMTQNPRCMPMLLNYFSHGPLARYVKLRVRMRRECRERFPRHREYAIPTCITARASRTCRDACRDR